MSFESTDERIERLENQVEALTKIEMRSLEMHQYLPKAIIPLQNDHIAILRFLANSPLIADDKVRQQFLTCVSRLERECEQMEAMVASFGKEIQNPEPPPDESQPPRQS
jgi:uncharacterized protein (UPF0335 family)